MNMVDCIKNRAQISKLIIFEKIAKSYPRFFIFLKSFLKEEAYSIVSI